MLFDEAVHVAQNADVVIAVLGDDVSQNGEGKDRANLELTGRQNELIARISQLGKPIVCVLVNGKPLILNEVEKYSNAIIETFNGGDMCGLATALLIKGEQNFSAKLPISFPTNSAAAPCYYNQYDYWHWGSYIDASSRSQYPFGFGLSYSNFIYGDVKLSQNKVKLGESVTLSVEIKNDSMVDGEEVVQLYFKDLICRIQTPIRTLLDFKKVAIPANKSVCAQFNISTNGLGYYNRDCEYVVDSGDFEFYISGDGKRFQTVKLTCE